MILELDRPDVELLRYALRAHIDLGFQSPERAVLLKFLNDALAREDVTPRQGESPREYLERRRILNPEWAS